MKFKEVLTRLTGFSVPIFGVSWQAPEAEVTVARRVIAFLEDRRVLYAPSEMELPQYCVQSVIEIRHFLTSEIGALDERSELAATLRAMRAACRKFINATQAQNGIVARFASQQGHWASWEFNGALGELRGVIGVHVAVLAARFGLDIEDNLAKIVPAADRERRPTTR
jgi:hypothetical protein